MPPKGRRSNGAAPSASSSSRHSKRASSNADHAAARIQRNSSKLPRSMADVYDFAVEQAGNGGEASSSSANRKAKKAQNRLKRATAPDTERLPGRTGGSRRGGGDGDDDDSDEEGPLGPRFLDASDDEAEGVRSEDDEELESDEAFGESDGELYDGVNLSNHKARGPAADEDSDEDEEEEDGMEEAEEDGMMDLSQMLDQASEDDDDDDDEGGEADSEDGDDRLQRRMTEIASSAKRSAEDGSDYDEAAEGPAGKKQRRLLDARNEAIAEGSFGTAASGQQLSIEDLLSPLAGKTDAGFSSLRQTAKALSKQGGKEAVASKKGGGALAAPLPGIVKDRIDRAAAYELSKQEAQGWAPTIKRVREAEHLSFPLQPEPKLVNSTASMTASFKPTTQMEKDIDALLRAGGLSEKQLAKQEELEMNERGMDKEEIQRRRDELRRMRELLFREEQKAKRVKKIKSKTFRKIARKERERDAAKLAAAGLGPDGEELEGEDEDREKMLRDRAMERATLKHKNAGKWAKSMVGRRETMENAHARNAVEEQLLQGERLRRRIEGIDSDEDDDSLDEDSEEEGDVDAKERAFDEIADLEAKTEAQRLKDEEALAKMGGKKGSVWNMKFMADARGREARATNEMVEEFRKELEGMDRDDGSEEEQDVNASAVTRIGKGGRAVYGSGGARSVPQAAPEAKRGMGSLLGTSRPEARSDEEVADEAPSGKAPRGGPTSASDAAESNPWLAASATGKSAKGPSRKNNDVIVGKDSSAASKAANKLSKHVAKGDEARREAEEDAALVIDPSAQIKVRQSESAAKKGQSSAPAPAPAAKAPTARPSRSGAVVAAAGDDSDDSDDSDAADEPVPVRGNGRLALRQRDLVAEAFAGDDVAAEFAAAKEAEIARDAPKEVDDSLPGWGSWSGKGVKKSASAKRKEAERKERFKRVIPGLEREQRKDAKMDNVIINERKDKKADRYKAKDIPFPYTSAAQYKMAMQQTLGPEWQTAATHQRLTLPKVTTKMGKAIKPVERKF